MTAQERITQALRKGENNAVSLFEMCTVSELIYESIGTGHENATSSEYLCNISGLSERDLRKTIEHLRRSGCVIISSNEGGYYKPADTTELKRFIHKENARALSVLKTLKSARNLLKEWGGEASDT